MAKETLYSKTTPNGQTVAILSVEGRGGNFEKFYLPAKLNLVVMEPGADYKNSRSPGVKVLDSVEYNKVASKSEASDYGKSMKALTAKADQVFNDLSYGKKQEHLEKHLAQVPTPSQVTASIGQGQGREASKRSRL